MGNASKVFIERVKTRMAEKHWSQRDLAERLGVQPPMISHYLKGNRAPNLEGLLKWADALEVSPGWLIDEQSVNESREPSPEDIVKVIAERFIENKSRLAIVGLALNADPELLETLTDAVRPFLDRNDKAKVSIR